MITIHEAIDNFVQAKRVEGISEVSIRWYKQHLVKFAAWLPADRTSLASIRHAFATKAINDGIRVEIVSKLLGHASLSFTLSVYASLLSQTQQSEYDAKWSTGAEVQHGT